MVSGGSNTVVELHQVSKTYQFGQNTVKALSQITMRVTAGEILGLVGASGAGKSTVLSLVGGLDTPTEGRIRVAGTDLAELKSQEVAHFRNQAVGFIFQTFNLMPVLTARENVALPAQLGDGDLSYKEICQRAEMLLESVGLAAQALQPVNRLSGGQMQRVAIARALMNKPKIILADEPTANLDERSAQSVLEILSKLCRQHHVTVMIATHDARVMKVCDRLITMQNGLIVS